MIFRTPEPPSSQPGGNTAADPRAAASAAPRVPDPGIPVPGTADPGTAAARDPAGPQDPAPDWEFIHEIERMVAGHHHNPHAILGAHLTDTGVTIRALRPLATSVTAVLPDGSKYPMPHLHQGVFEVTLPAGVAAVPDYRLEVTYEGGSSASLGGTPTLQPPAEIRTIQDDPYRHLPTVGELDLYLIGEGRHEAAPASARCPRAAVRYWAAQRGGRSGKKSPGPHSPSGHRTPAGSASPATSISGTGRPTRCGRSARPVSGSCSCPVSTPALSTSSGCAARTASGGRRPTRWPPTPRCRPPPPRWCSSRTMTGATWPGSPAGRTGSR